MTQFENEITDKDTELLKNEENMLKLTEEVEDLKSKVANYEAGSDRI
jgi:phage shock protein A